MNGPNAQRPLFSLAMMMTESSNSSGMSNNRIITTSENTTNTISSSSSNSLGARLANDGHCPANGWPLHADSADVNDDLINEDDPMPNSDTLHELPMGTSYAKTLRSRSRKLSKGPFKQTTVPIKAVRASKQYIYDDKGQEYLDCINATAHVGHCHPQVVSAGQAQISRLCTAQGFQSQNLNNYVKELVNTLPERLSVCYMCNSGSEANDLAIRLARQYTGAEDILVHEDTYHGNLGVLVDISPKVHSQIPGYKPKPWLHTLQMPNTFSGKYTLESLPGSQQEIDNIMDKYFEDVLLKLNQLKGRGVRLAALIMDSFLVIPGLFKPSKKYMQSLFVSVRQMGGLVIVDEVQTGLGRTGDNFWGFQNFGVVPDIMTVGKPLGSGYPIGATFCSREISEKLGGYFSTFGGNPVSCAIGMASLNVIFNEKLVSSAENVGRLHGNMLRDVMKKYPEMLGDVRGQGLMWILEFILDRESRKPSPELTRTVMYGLRSKHILVGITGKFKNMIVFTPPMCFTITNSRRFCSSLSEVLSECAATFTFTNLSIVNQSSPSTTSGVVSRKRNLEQGQDLEGIRNISNSHYEESNSSGEEEEDISESFLKMKSEEERKRAKLELENYEQID